MDPSTLHPSLLRPPVLHILRAAGFTTTRPSVLDTLVDLTSRHLLLLATQTHRHALLRQPNINDPYPVSITLPDVRMAMQDAGLFYPSTGEMEEGVRGEEDLRGVEAFVGWCVGDGNREIRRVAGMETASALPNENSNLITNPKTTTDPATETLEDVNQDYLTQLKRKHAKTRDGEEARYAGTVLGRDRDAAEIKIEGWGEVGNFDEWSRRLQTNSIRAKEAVEVQEMEVEDAGNEGRRSTSSSPLSDIIGYEVGE